MGVLWGSLRGLSLGLLLVARLELPWDSPLA